jgi:ABC-2 type transport system ATP-binding protein
VIQVENLRKTFGDTIAVDGISFTAEPGGIFGLLGPNGAGKTTTISCISALLKPTDGHITIMGHDVVRDAMAAKATLGLVPQETALYEDVSARENLHFWAGCYGMRGQELSRRITEVLDLVGLLDRAEEAVSKYSGGMKRRLNFGCGIIHTPQVLLLDEPTVGVDPQSRVRLLDLVRQQADAGVTVLYTTHYMEEAEAICDQIAIIDDGKILAMGSREELRSQVGEADIIRITGKFEPDAVAGAVQEKLPGVEMIEAGSEEILFSMQGAAQNLGTLLSTVQGTGAVLRETAVREPNLETLFIKLTGKELRE